ncbi:MAG: hypothetical protein NZT92_19690 [Abditibacteriales bacterium]|nr:hypothetical protein [Abditibacteriales bacterium]MDW8367931.1 hypothetical protein [Abditibacteriales bacterium]
MAAGIPDAGGGQILPPARRLSFPSGKAAQRQFPYSTPPTSRAYTDGADNCPNAKRYPENFIRWATFCEKYQPEHCELAAGIVRAVAERNRM